MTSTQASLRKSALWRVATPREGASTVRESKAGVEPAFPGNEVSGIFTTSVGSAAYARAHAANQKFVCGACRAALLQTPKESALPSVSGSSPRSLRQAPRAWARAFPREPRDPGLPFRPQAGQTDSASVRCRRATKNPPEHLAREGSHQRANCRSRLRRDRSHGPGTRYRSARGRSTVGRAFRVRGSSSDSWSFANPIVCEGAGHTPARGNCQLACETIFQWRERSVQRVAGKAHRPMLGRHRSMLTTGWPAGLHASSIAGNHTRQQKARHSTGGQRCRNRNLPLGGSRWSWRL